MYQGEELGLTQAVIPFDRLRDPEAIANWPLTLGRDGARTPMPWSSASAYAGFSDVEPWLPIPPDHLACAVSEQNGAADSVLEIAREVLELRRSSPALRSGSFLPLDLPPPLLGFERVSGPQRLRCLFNLDDAPRDCSELASGEVLFVQGNVDRDKGVLGGLAVCILEMLGPV